MDHLFDQAVDRIARVYEQIMLAESPFHLASCGGCGGPSFQQPCSLCGHYPMGLDKGPERAKATAERFRRAVEASASGGTGNLATWYFRSFTKNLAYEKRASYRAKVDALIAEGAKLTDLPHPDAVFQHVSVDRNAIHREYKTVEANSLWRVVSEVAFAFNKEAEEVERTGRFSLVSAGLRKQADEASKLAVMAIHGDDSAWDAAVDGLDAVIRDLLKFIPGTEKPASWVPWGNLVSAQDELEDIRQRRNSSVPAPAL